MEGVLRTHAASTPIAVAAITASITGRNDPDLIGCHSETSANDGPVQAALDARGEPSHGGLIHNIREEHKTLPVDSAWFIDPKLIESHGIAGSAAPAEITLASLATPPCDGDEGAAYTRCFNNLTRHQNLRSSPQTLRDLLAVLGTKFRWRDLAARLDGGWNYATLAWTDAKVVARWPLTPNEFDEFDGQGGGFEILTTLSVEPALLTAVLRAPCQDGGSKWDHFYAACLVGQGAFYARAAAQDADFVPAAVWSQCFRRIHGPVSSIQDECKLYEACAEKSLHRMNDALSKGEPIPSDFGEGFNADNADMAKKAAKTFVDGLIPRRRAKSDIRVMQLIGWNALKHRRDLYGIQKVAETLCDLHEVLGTAKRPASGDEELDKFLSQTPREQYKYLVDLGVERSAELEEMRELKQLGKKPKK